MPIDFDAVLQSKKARDSLFITWYNDVLQEEAKEVLTLGWFGDGPENSGTHRVVEWNDMYFFLGDDGHVEEGPFNSLDEVLALPELRGPMVFRPNLDSSRAFGAPVEYRPGFDHVRGGRSADKQEAIRSFRRKVGAKTSNPAVTRMPNLTHP